MVLETTNENMEKVMDMVLSNRKEIFTHILCIKQVAANCQQMQHHKNIAEQMLDEVVDDLDLLKCVAIDDMSELTLVEAS